MAEKKNYGRIQYFEIEKKCIIPIKKKNKKKSLIIRPKRLTESYRYRYKDTGARFQIVTPCHFTVKKLYI